MIHFVCFFGRKLAAELISCDVIVTCLDFENCCFGNVTASINSKTSKFDGTEEETVHAIWFANNTNIKYLPIQVFLHFPKLALYNAENCAISEISKENFENLSELEAVNLAGNQIEVVQSDTFDSIIGLERIDLGKLVSIDAKPE